MRIALGLAYDGTGLQGYQTQAVGLTVQDQLEAALARFCLAPVATVVAGRTDAGVHARGQVVHLDAPCERPLWSWVRGVNAFLPAAIRIRWAASVPADFHARYAARSRTYRYRIHNEPVDCPLRARHSTWVFQPLMLAPMQEAARQLLGEHDFTSFRSSQCQAASPVRRLNRFEVHQEGTDFWLEIEANAFLQHMVRNLVGSLVEVGRGVQPVGWLRDLLDARDRAQAARTFPAQGLCLWSVAYDLDFEATPRLPLT
jgi:pseudouridylate synthase I